MILSESAYVFSPVLRMQNDSHACCTWCWYSCSPLGSLASGAWAS